MPNIAELFVYPLKSAAGIPLETAELDTFGIRYDRRWMVVDGRGEFMTQRDLPALALIRTSFEDGMLHLEADPAGEFRLPLDGSDGPEREVRVWRDLTRGIDAGNEAAAWVSTALRRPARILYMPAHVRRPLDPTYAPGPGRVSFADGFPLLMISRAAIDMLNERLDRPLPVNRFRPNLVVDGTAPHEEDHWRRFRSGDLTFDVVKPCARCVITTIDQTTGLPGREPLRTLATYRRLGSKVLFGQNVVHSGPGMLRVGDPIEVIERNPGPVLGGVGVVAEG